MSELGLRQQKKEQTRERIKSAAFDLFVERGFERVTVAEIAAAASVSEKTVFNYFATKEDLLYGVDVEFEQRLLAAVRTRARGVAAATSAAWMFKELFRRLDDPGAADILRERAKLVAASPALQLREREIFARYAESLGRLLAEETRAHPDDGRPFAAASAIVGAHHAVLRSARQRALGGQSGRALTNAVQREAKRVFGLVETGLSDYAVK